MRPEVSFATSTDGTRIAWSRHGRGPHGARTVFEAAPDPKELLEIEGGHFGLLYHPGSLFDQVSAAQAEFLVRHLAG